MEEIGVQAVVKGLSSFLSDLGKIDQGLKGLAPSGNLLTNIFSGIGNAAATLGREILNVAEFALGHLLADAIEFIIGKLRDLAAATFDAASEFQSMELRLNRLNLNSAIEDGNSYTRAMGMATVATQEQLDWVRKLAVTTPYDAKDIANTFTLARSYGFAADAAKGLTRDISNFASGMGLGNTEIQRIIVNFGQMVQQGKVTQRELNDLARGAFVPVNDILAEMEKQTGKTGASFDAFKKTGEGVNAFFKAFTTLVGERFTGAAEDMARTFKGATDNAADFLKNLLGFNVVLPILDAIGGKIADVITQLTGPVEVDPKTVEENLVDPLDRASQRAAKPSAILSPWEQMNLQAKRVGDELGKTISEILDLGPDLSTLPDQIVGGLKSIADWISTHRDDIVGFFEDARDTAIELWEAVKDKDFEGFLEALGLDAGTIDKITEFKDTITESLDAVKSWVDENGPLVSEFFTTLGEIVGKVFENLSGEQGGTATLDSLLEGVTNFMQYVVDNKDAIAEFLTKLTAFFILLQAVTFVWGILTTIVLAFLSPILAIAGAVAGLIGVVVFVIPVLVTLGTVLGVVAAALATGYALFLVIKGVVQGLTFAWLFFTAQIQSGVELMKKFWGEALASTKKTLDDIVKAFKSGDWVALGKALVDGIIRGVNIMKDNFIKSIKNLINNAINAAMEALGIGSPSKVFMEIGEQTMQGLALGIENLAGMVAGTMERAVAGIAMPAYALPSTAYAAASPSVTNSATTNNYMNLTVNSAARSEQVAADFNMMRSLIQG